MRDLVGMGMGAVIVGGVIERIALDETKVGAEMWDPLIFERLFLSSFGEEGAGTVGGGK